MENLKRLRTSCNLTQKEMADKLGMNQQTYANYETGRREPDFDTLKEIASYFNVSIDFLLDIDDKFIKNENHENFSINFETAIQLCRRNYYEFVTELYKYIKNNQQFIIRYETLEQTYSKIFSWITGESIPSFFEQRIIEDILDYHIDLMSDNLLYKLNKRLPKSYDTLKKEAIIYYDKIYMNIDLEIDDYYDFYVIMKHDLLIKLNLLKNGDFYEAISKKSLQSMQESYKECLTLIDTAMRQENRKRYEDFRSGTILLRNKVMQINDESQSKNITRRKHLLMFFYDINITTIDDRDIKNYHTDFLENLYKIITDQIKSNQFLYYIVRDHDIRRPVDYITNGYNYCYESFTNIEQAQDFLKKNSVGFAKKLTNYNDPIEKANALKRIINVERKEINDKAFKALYSIDEEKK
ncbi:MAG: helix-turn-helix domain-containing protein [[Clostridium] innocuum]|nr:helix-turn-helix transcriptional regulator [Erysipelotrichaceae bacterium]MCR0131152.1 helix-turn-helix domain-containing protein [[Clostridium] innocuum]MCR0386699.1 helix-turn-helix domain-containing protein [[Clostridium] innocuum]MCR0419198.1 helix-turn-helix domain-containing protein [[Clostridium] innocuum]MCR0561123.1 helix-turn-helix domain-containing protein [[Clostridium] innocuum]